MCFFRLSIFFKNIFMYTGSLSSDVHVVEPGQCLSFPPIYPKTLGYIHINTTHTHIHHFFLFGFGFRFSPSYSSSIPQPLYSFFYSNQIEKYSLISVIRILRKHYDFFYFIFYIINISRSRFARAYEFFYFI